MNKILLLILFFTCNPQVHSQSHVYKHYGVEDGLPTSEVYSAFQDSKGYMWFASDAGVSKFNGYEFENFNVSDGLTDNTVFLITEDHKGRIWFGTFNCELSYYENDSIYPYKYNHVIKAGIKEKRPIQSFAVDSNNTVWIGFMSIGIFKISENGELQQIIDVPKDENFNFYYHESEQSSVFGTLLNNNKKESLLNSYNLGLDVEISFKLKFKYNNIYYTDTLIVNGYEPAKSTFQMSTYKEGFVVFTYNNLFFLEVVNGKIQKRKVNTNLFSETVTSVMVDEDYLWICSNNEGVYQCEIKDNQLLVIDHFLKDNSVSRLFKDSNQGYWFATLNNGIYYMKEKDIQCIKDEHYGGIRSLAVDSKTGDIFCGFSKGNIVKISEDTLNPSFTDLLNLNAPCNSLLFNDDKGYLIIGTVDSTNCLPCYKDGHFFHFPYFNIGSNKAMMIEEGIFYCVGSSGIIEYTNEQQKFDSYYNGEEKIWCTSVVNYQDEIWIGSKEGVRIYSNKKIVNRFVEDSLLSSVITVLVKWSSRVLLIGTISHGVVILQDGQIISCLSKKDGLLSNQIKQIHIDKEGVVWIGTNRGLNKVEILADRTFKIKDFTMRHGLISNEINALSSYNYIIYVGTPKGLIQFDKTKINSNSTPPPVYITEFVINSEIKDTTEFMNFFYNENFIKVSFEGLNYRSLGQVEYQYRLLGADPNWVSTTHRSVQYPFLQPGAYTFEVKAKNEDGFWSGSSRISFTINPPFWITWWFITIEIIFGITFIAGIFWYREKQIRGKVQVSKRMVELELKALRSQMNPHFIFNVLNSIQHFIAINDFKSSNKYIVKFTTLIRTILHLSEKSVITVQEEIDILTMYMDLEKMRFEEQFIYQIEVSDEIDTDYEEIPSMLLQPYVENAIWHGLMNKVGKGVIKIKITQKNEHLYCSIEDNGIGRKKAAEIRAKRNIKQKSVGMTVTKERLDLISNGQVNVEIIDLEDENGEPTGTKITIKIQYKN